MSNTDLRQCSKDQSKELSSQCLAHAKCAGLFINDGAQAPRGGLDAVKPERIETALAHDARSPFERPLLDLYRCSYLFQLGLDILGLFLSHSLLDRLGSPIYQILGFLQTKPGDSTYHFDDLYLLITNGG